MAMQNQRFLSRMAATGYAAAGTPSAGCRSRDDQRFGMPKASDRQRTVAAALRMMTPAQASSWRTATGQAVAEWQMINALFAKNCAEIFASLTNERQKVAPSVFGTTATCSDEDTSPRNWPILDRKNGIHSQVAERQWGRFSPVDRKSRR